ncbi:SGNH/GDSL hydrolase family protein, partial [Arsukibacterium sp.]|uniref:SGNH/GDSL hydrolase family protein n=1 Tax=Arsukibacterium sp. TaxID=1977258 RepID=UPI0029A9D46C|nr:arylesterase [Arsukibacterium sp.]
ELIQTNLSKIITLIQQHNAEPLLMQIRIPPNYGPRYVRQFTALYPQLAEKHNITLWPFFMDSIAINSNLMMADGIHPNAAAQPLISDFMADLLRGLPSKN